MWCRAVLDIQMALGVFTEVYANLWPQDPTPRLLNRLMVEYEFGAAIADSERDRCRVMEDFVDDVLRESAGRANRSKPPLSYRQLRERWRDLTDKKRGPTNPVQKPAASHTGPVAASSSGSSRGGKTNSGGRGGRSGTQQRGTAAKFGGNAVCYLFNSRKNGCPRTSKPGGCDDGKGGIYAHVCNFESSPGQHCLAAHPRHANH